MPLPTEKHWYAVATKARRELWARSNLWEREIEVYLPLVRRWRRHSGKRDLVSYPLFPGYLFVEADLQITSSRAIDMAQGVRGLVRFGERLPTVPGGVIEGIRQLEDESGHIDLDAWRGGFRPGDLVQIAKGVMADVTAIVESIDAKMRIVVLLELLGRQVRARVDRDQIIREG